MKLGAQEWVGWSVWVVSYLLSVGAAMALFMRVKVIPSPLRAVALVHLGPLVPLTGLGGQRGVFESWLGFLTWLAGTALLVLMITVFLWWRTNLGAFLSAVGTVLWFAGGVLLYLGMQSV